MRMICRPLLLHNEFIPARLNDNDAREDWNYQVFGYHDGITVKKSFPVRSVGDLEKVFKTYADYESELHPYFTQFLFGFTDCSERDRKFWADEAPFLYISLIQFCDKDVLHYKKALEKAQEDGVEKVVYYSLDNSDLIIAIKCHEARKGAEYIDMLHRNRDAFYPFRIQNSYSIFALNKKKNAEGDLGDWGDEIIDLMELRIIKRTSEAADKLYEQLKKITQRNNCEEAIERKSLLGSDDEAIFLRGIKWKEILPLYREETGILCNSNSCAQAYANAVSTKVMWPMEGDVLADYFMKPKQSDPELRLTTIMCNKLHQIYKGCTDTNSSAEKKNLMLLISAMSRFEALIRSKEGFSDYSFFPVLFPLYTFINLLGEEDLRGTDGKVDAPAVFYYEFIKHLKLCTQNFTKPDRVYMQVADFNMRYFEIPEKLVALYNAYIYYFKRCLYEKDEQRSYEFLVCPGVNCEVEVKELFARFSEKSRLVMIELPEHQMYNPQTMFVALGHEIAHFVGRKIRLRAERYEIIIDLMSHVIALKMKSYFAEEKCFDESLLQGETWEKVEHKINDMIHFYVNRIVNKDYLEKVYFADEIFFPGLIKNQNYNERNYQHTQVLEKILTSAIEDMLLNRGIESFDYIIKESFKENVAKEGYEYAEQCVDVQKDTIMQSINTFLYAHNTQSQIFTLQKAIDKVLYLMKECYADVVCILLLRLSAEDYYKSFIRFFESMGKRIDDMFDTVLMTRIALVTYVISYEPEEKYIDKKYFRWTQSLCKNKANNHVFKLQEKALIYIKMCIAEEYKISDVEILNNIENINYDQKMLKYYAKYLLKCRRKFYDFINDKETENRMKYVRKIYRSACNKTSEEQFGEMMNFIKKYRQDVQIDIEKL